MHTDQQPVMHRCSEYSINIPKYEKRESLHFRLAEFLLPLQVQRTYRGKSWVMRWKIISRKGGSASFQWWREDARSSKEGRHTVTLQFSRDGQNGDSTSARYSCSLDWEKDTNRQLLLSVDEGMAYNWFRFRFLEFAEVVAARIVEKGSVSSHPVVYDPVGGTCWFPLLIKARLPKTRVVCSDISQEAIRVAQENFQKNDLRGHFLVGDLFQPLQELVQRRAELRPQFVCFLPPQETSPESIITSSMNVPAVSVFVPGQDMFYFFRRMTSELPPLLAANASVFISVAHAHTKDVIEIFLEAGWPSPRVHLSRYEMGHASRLFYNPSGLIEFELS